MIVLSCFMLWPVFFIFWGVHFLYFQPGIVKLVYQSHISIHCLIFLKEPKILSKHSKAVTATASEVIEQAHVDGSR